MTSTYDFTATSPDGGEVPLARLRGQGAADRQRGQQVRPDAAVRGPGGALPRRQGPGLEILGFPCNQFKGQEPGTDAEIQDFCKTTYDVTFPVFSKVEVNGPDADPLYQYLRTEAPGDFGPAYGEFYEAISQDAARRRTARTRSSGTSPSSCRPRRRVIKRYEPPVPPATSRPTWRTTSSRRNSPAELKLSVTAW